MGRRRFLQSIAIVGAGILTAGTSKLDIFFSRPTVRNVTIYFPPNKSFSTFCLEVPKWMSHQKWQACLEKFKSSGALLAVDKTVLLDRVIYDYKFRSHENLLEFNRVAGEICSANLEARKELGYSCDVKLV